MTNTYTPPADPATTPQEMFNRAWHGVIAQGRPGKDADALCCYWVKQGDTVLMCGIGHVLGTKIAKTWKDEESLFDVFEEYDRFRERIQMPAVLAQNRQLALELQVVHDTADKDEPDFIESFRKHMIATAAKYGLEVPA